MKTIERSHAKWNIQFTEFTAEALQNLNAEQAAAMAEFFTTMSRRMAESEFLLASHENGWEIPAEITNDYK